MIGKKRLHAGLLMLALLGTTWAVHAEVYKWVDADGKTQYGDEPPKGVKAKVVNGGVTVVPASRFTGTNASASKPAAASESSAKPADAKDAASASSADAAAESRRKAVERCEKNRGTDCEEEADSQTLPNGEVYRPVPGWSRPPIRPGNAHNESSQASSSSAASRKTVRKVPEANQSGARK